MVKAGGAFARSSGRLTAGGSSRRRRSVPRTRRSRGGGEDLLALAFTIVAVTPIIAVWAVLLAGALPLDGGRNVYAATRREPRPGIALTNALWLYAWRLHLQRFLGPPPLEVRTLRELLALRPAAFEAAVATLARRLGYEHVRVVGRAGDYGVDVAGRDAEGRSVVIQCKRYAPHYRVGSKEVQTFVGMATVHHHADIGIFVTTSSFTRHCFEIAERSRGRIQLLSGHDLARLLARTTDSESAPASAPVAPPA